MRISEQKPQAMPKLPQTLRHEPIDYAWSHLQARSIHKWLGRSCWRGGLMCRANACYTYPYNVRLGLQWRYSVTSCYLEYWTGFCFIIGVRVALPDVGVLGYALVAGRSGACALKYDTCIVDTF